MKKPNLGPHNLITLTKPDFVLTAADGKQLFGRCWVPDNPIAVVCLVHGLGEHIGRYEHVAHHLSLSNIAVYGHDQRGHGHNSGKKGHANCRSLWNDLEWLMKFARLKHLELPLFLYGHSWGGNIVSNYLLRKNSAEIKGAILSSPWLQLSFEPSKLERNLGQWMSRIYPAFTQSNGLNVDFLSRDLEIGTAYMADPLVHDKISAGLFTEAEHNGQYALNHAHKLTKPTLVIHGTDDKVTAPQASTDFVNAAAQEATLKLWPDMRHETHNEFGKEEVLQYLTSWLVKMTV